MADQEVLATDFVAGVGFNKSPAPEVAGGVDGFLHFLGDVQMGKDTSSSLLSQLADIFRREGDLATAAALERQVNAETPEALDDEDSEWLQALERRASAFEWAGNYDEAIASFQEALRVAVEAYGTHHVGIELQLNNLARCLSNAGEYAEALRHYMHLLRIMKQAYGSEDPQTTLTRENVVRCRQALQDRAATRRLQAQVECMVHQSKATLSLDHANHRARTMDICRRLVSRGRNEAAVSLCDRLVANELAQSDPDDDVALGEIRECAMLLREAGALTKSAATLRKLVVLRNLQCSLVGDQTNLLAALADLESCLAAMGDTRSSHELAQLTHTFKGNLSN